MRKELVSLRELMSNYGIDVYIVPTNDFHGSEYINDYFKTRCHISGFTGSAGTLIVTHDEARLWTDGRYFLQAGIQLKDSGIELMKDGEPEVPTIAEYLEATLSEGNVLGFDGRVLSCALGDTYAKIAESKDASVAHGHDLAGEAWLDRPVLSGSDVWAMPESSCGSSFAEKISEVRKTLAAHNANYHLITGLEENAWLYNLRGSDVEHTPVFFAFTLVTPVNVILYAFEDAFRNVELPEGVSIRSYFMVTHDLAELPPTSTLYADLKNASYALIKAVPADCRIIDKPSPVTLFKALKNEAEIRSTKAAHIGDGAAMANFICWVKDNVGKLEMDEISAADYLAARRAEQEGFLDLSFETICGYMSNGAIIHYGATPETSKKIEPNGLLLVDSGGQYLTGTTDITRTLAVGPLTDKMKRYYTAVLRGHIDLAMARFAEGTTGADLDIITRAPLLEEGINYNHGTGHGVGHVLSVHEGPQNISKKGDVQPFLPGMITSDEPGVYIEGEFGIRIENELLCVKTDSADGKNLHFENITLCPYERDAILPDMLTTEERSYLNAYHKRVYDTISPLVSDHVREWLAAATAEI